MLVEKTVMEAGRKSGAPNFKRVSPVCCYHCQLMMPDGKKWVCKKYKIEMGTTDDDTSCLWQAEFVCDDFEVM